MNGHASVEMTKLWGHAKPATDEATDFTEIHGSDPWKSVKSVAALSRSFDCAALRMTDFYLFMRLKYL